jgi:predicted transcriptional regulator
MNRQNAVVTAILFRDGAGVAGFIEEIPTANAKGRTERDVRNQLRKAVQDFYAENRENFALRLETRENVRRERLAVEVDMPEIDGL